MVWRPTARSALADGRRSGHTCSSPTARLPCLCSNNLHSSCLHLCATDAQLSVPSSPRRLGGPGLAALNACTVHEQFKAALAAAPPARGSRGTSSMPLQPALPASPFSQTELQAQQHAAQPSPPKSPTPAVAELMRTLTLSDMALSGSPPSSGAASAAAAPPALGITPACAESLAPWR